MHDLQDPIRQPSLLGKSRENHCGPRILSLSLIFKQRCMGRCSYSGFTFSDGFKIIVFPHAAAMGNIQRGIMAGKLNGQMPLKGQEY